MSEPAADAPRDLFLAAPPGLEEVLACEARAAGFAVTGTLPGGVTVPGGWREVWRANLALRGAGRVLVRLGGFRALHLAQLDKRARRFPWAEVLRPDMPVRVEATCRASRIYHAGAAAQRIGRAIAEELGAPVVTGETAEGAEAPLRLLARIEDDFCGFSIDTSGAPLHRRGTKQAVGKAPLRETLAALFLRRCGYAGTEPVLDPMCGSGTFLLEAAGIAAGHLPGRARAFAFERLATFDAEAVAALRAAPPGPWPDLAFHGFDRDAGAVRMAQANAERAGLSDLCAFACRPVSDLTRPDGPPGLVIVNPPYGGRIGTKGLLRALYGSLGGVLRARFSGWRVGLVTSEDALARATGLPFGPPDAPVPHGPLKVRLWRTGALP